MPKSEQLYHLENELDYYEDKLINYPRNASFQRHIDALRNELSVTRAQNPIQPQRPAQVQPHTQPQVHPQTHAQVQPHTQPQVHPQTHAQVQPHTQPQVHPQTHAQVQPQAQQTTRITIESLLSNQSLAVLVTTWRLNVSSFVRSLIMALGPLFSAIISLGLLGLVLHYAPLIIEVYTMLDHILGYYFMWIMSMVFSVLCFLTSLLLTIRRAKNSIGIYDR
jgi:hypothetical protein